MRLITETLVFPYRRKILDEPAAGSRLLFLNAGNPDILPPTEAVLIQPRYDRAQPFLAAGHTVLDNCLPLHENMFDTVWVLPGKDLMEMQYLLAQALRAAKKNALIVAAAENHAGGRRLEGAFEELGLLPAAESKHKARVVFATVPKQWNNQQATRWQQQGVEQAILNSALVSRPGLHSWNEIDEGSALLARHFPADLKGSVADFGCGWGYLSLQAAMASKKITRLTLADIDARAIKTAKKNVQQQNPDLQIDTVWADLSQQSAPLGRFDAILLNPPFHEGSHAVPALGQAIIATAARSLAPTGQLYLVANQHLPYEKTLVALFANVETAAEEKGFKIFICQQLRDRVPL